MAAVAVAIIQVLLVYYDQKLLCCTCNMPYSAKEQGQIIKGFDNDATIKQ